MTKEFTGLGTGGRPWELGEGELGHAHGEKGSNYAPDIED